MEEFYFEIDKKYEVWERASVCVEANSEEEANDIIINAVKNGDEGNYDPEYEILYETMECLSVEDNNGMSTVEIRNFDEGELIYDNSTN